jgi:hypothetical protein
MAEVRQDQLSILLFKTAVLGEHQVGVQGDDPQPSNEMSRGSGLGKQPAFLNLLHEEKKQDGSISSLNQAKEKKREEKIEAKERRRVNNSNNLKGAHHFKDLVENEDADDHEALSDNIVKLARKRRFVYPLGELKPLRIKFGFKDAAVELVTSP